MRFSTILLCASALCIAAAKRPEYLDDPYLEDVWPNFGTDSAQKCLRKDFYRTSCIYEKSDKDIIECTCKNKKLLQYAAKCVSESAGLEDLDGFANRVNVVCKPWKNRSVEEVISWGH
ncbi:hypothetical protein NA57DRAFT_50543 [Rhizodiscina lignyota]|uniref:Extracellular membrane protein CFEM domain-containing protein n=1 Tax=Rhizodiscina lignyota TaxID=1504668 RepID=A0A9P4ILD6_9PEZI|nr:hypothetical protein NA57DRAFT_50543 [Rhizodiscina lignyota]